MKKRLAVILVLVAITLILPVWAGGGKAFAETINIIPYYIGGGVGDSWTYTYTYNNQTPLPDFTVYLTQVSGGGWDSKYRWGDFVSPNGSSYYIVDWDTNGINVYEADGNVFSPPGLIPATLPINEMFANPLGEANNYWYFQKLPSLTVSAGTFYDVLVHIALDDRFGPTTANDLFGLGSLPYGVTHVEWMAAGIGTIQDRDYNETGNSPFEYQLTATTVPLPPSLVFLGSGLLGLVGWRRFGKG